MPSVITVSAEGRVNEISISPDEKIRLVPATGNSYLTENIDSNWHYGKPLFKTSDDYSFDNPNLERISFFNKDTAILTGYISVSKKEYKKNEYYLTKDAGKSWKLLCTWIPKAFGSARRLCVITTNCLAQKDNLTFLGGRIGIEFGKSFNKCATYSDILTLLKSSDKFYLGIGDFRNISIFVLRSRSAISSLKTSEFHTKSQ